MRCNWWAEKEYHSFLQATLKSLQSEHQDVYAGYFSEDRGSSDADIQAEVEDILSNKEKLLSFKDKDGNWLTRRFLFPKWTLREGWDNPIGHYGHELTTVLICRK